MSDVQMTVLFNLASAETPVMGGQFTTSFHPVVAQDATDDLSSRSLATFIAMATTAAKASRNSTNAQANLTQRLCYEVLRLAGGGNALATCYLASLIASAKGTDMDVASEIVRLWADVQADGIGESAHG